MEYYLHIGLHAGTVGIKMPAKGTYFPEHPEVDDTFTHQRCMIGENYLGGADHPLNPCGDVSDPTREERDTGYLVYVFPAFTMAMCAESNNWLSFRPDGPESTRVLGGYLVWRELVSSDPNVTRARAELIEKANAEDALATTELARTMRSRKAPPGTALALREDACPVLQVPWTHLGRDWLTAARDLSAGNLCHVFEGITRQARGRETASKTSFSTSAGRNGQTSHWRTGWSQPTTCPSQRMPGM